MLEKQNLSLRRADAGDQPFLDLLYSSTRDDLLVAAADPAMIGILMKMQQQIQDGGHRSAYPDAVHWVIEQHGQALGRIVIDTDLRHGMRVVDIALLPQARNLGHGRELLRHLQQQAAALKLPLRLAVARENAAARHLYLSQGFELASAGSVTDELVWRPGAAS